MPNSEMANSEQARAEILSLIRQANRAAALDQPDSATNAARDAAWEALPRAYQRSGGLSLEAVLKLFEQRLEDYGAHVFHATAAELPDAVARILAERGKPRIVIPAGIPAGWLPPHAVMQEDEGFSAVELDRFDGVITGATVAIAATGTIVLQNAPAQGRRAISLVPDYHLCIVAEEQVVETVPEAFARLAATGLLPTTFISGPSATADIEMTRIQGVHGPRVLDVILVEQPVKS